MGQQRMFELPREFLELQKELDRRSFRRTSPRYENTEFAVPGTLAERRKKFISQQGFRRISPRYEITDNEEKFKVALDLPGVKAEDINVSYEEDNKVLSITGQRQAGNDDYSFTSKFSQSFYLDRTVEVEKLTANLENGVLVVSAPKDHKRLEIGIRKIPIQQSEAYPDKDHDATTTESESEKVEVHTKGKMEEKPHAAPIGNDKDEENKSV